MIAAKVIKIVFLLTRLLRGVTFNYALTSPDKEFLLTRLLRGVTDTPNHIICHNTISTHTPLARRDQLYVVLVVGREISTHTPLARRDDKGYPVKTTQTKISTHTPLARRDVQELPV